MKASRLELLMAACLLWVSTPVQAYDQFTHEEMSEQAARASLIGRDDKNQLLNNLGLGYLANNKEPIFNLFRDGANFEDDFPRSLNHFYDPLRNRGLFGVNVASPDWALEDRADFGDAQEFSYKDAREFLYKALTEKEEQERRKQFDSTFRTLGHIIHHLQDMAQPQHVRNDVHPSIGAHKSLYEEYTDGHRGNLPFTDANYNAGNPVRFPTARHFWTSNGQGLADFTNRNFVSAGTNYRFITATRSRARTTSSRYRAVSGRWFRLKHCSASRARPQLLRVWWGSSKTRSMTPAPASYPRP